MQEVFFELLPGVSLKANKTNYSFSIIDPIDKKTLDYSPILMIDGIMIDDAALIANLDPQIVEKIDVVRSKYVVGDLIFYGLINVITRQLILALSPCPHMLQDSLTKFMTLYCRLVHPIMLTLNYYKVGYRISEILFTGIPL